MSMLGVSSALTGMYQYTATKDVNKADTSGTDFISQMKKTGEAAEPSRVDAYAEYLRSKYGNVRIQSVGKDQRSLDRIGKSMNGSDVVIAPNILEQMANDSEKAAYYEGKIDDFFNATPRLRTAFAAQGLDYQPCGVVVHEDGSVTYIGGCADSPERVAEVNAINKVKREKEAAQRKASLERSQEAAEERKEQMEIAYRKQAMVGALANRAADAGRITYTVAPEIMGSAVATYEKSIMETGDIAISSWADAVRGSSISVYKTPDFNPENPVYKVKIWDKSGNVTEQMVDVSKVDPKNCNTAEMYAYTVNLKESGKGSFEDTVLKAAVAKAIKNAEQRSSASWSFLEKTDWVNIVNDIMQSEYHYGDLKGYMEWKRFLGFLDK